MQAEVHRQVKGIPDVLDGSPIAFVHAKPDNKVQVSGLENEDPVHAGWSFGFGLFLNQQIFFPSDQNETRISGYSRLITVSLQHMLTILSSQ